jgi:hypothetical protein
MNRCFITAVSSFSFPEANPNNSLTATSVNRVLSQAEQLADYWSEN